MAREGILIEPYSRMNQEQIEKIHRASIEILLEPGITCYNSDAAELFSIAGAEVTRLVTGSVSGWQLKIPEKVVWEAVESAPETVILGARDEKNCLVLNGREPRVRFASGSEANNWLNVTAEEFVARNDSSRILSVPAYSIEKGTAEKLACSAHLCEQLDSWDGFLRNVNIQDEDIDDTNKDVNKFFVSLNNTTKHVMAGLTSLGQLDNLLTMAEIIAGGRDAFRNNPIISIITSLIKSPLQFVDDTSEKTIEVARRGIPLVISSAPQGGSTAPIMEAGIVAQINAEILAGICLAQLSRKGAPVLYGSVPGRADMTDLHDTYGVPEFSQYNIDCVQMARYYGIPCYSSGGVSDAKIPGIQASVERLFSQIMVTLAGPQYLHYAFGLLDRTSTFCPVQAVLDDVHLHMVKRMVADPDISDDSIAESLNQTRKVMESSTKLFTRFARSSLRSGKISLRYPFASPETNDETLIQAMYKTEELMKKPRRHIDEVTIEKIYQNVPGLLSRLRIN